MSSWRIIWAGLISNVSACLYLFAFLFVQAPTAKCKNIEVQLVGNGVSILATDVDDSSTDACGIHDDPSTAFVLDKSSFTCAEKGANTVTLTVTDGSYNANPDTCTSTVTVEDNVVRTRVF